MEGGEGGNQVKEIVIRREMLPEQVDQTPGVENVHMATVLVRYTAWLRPHTLPTMHGSFHLPTQTFMSWHPYNNIHHLMSILITFLAWCFPAKNTYFRFLCFQLYSYHYYSYNAV